MLPVLNPRHPSVILALEPQYRFLSILGQGGAGTVFEVEHRILRRREALKILGEALGPEARERFLHEARVCASLEHPGIVRIHDIGEAAGLPWYAMQRVDGPSLARLMEAALDAGATCRLVAEVAEALAFSHGRGIIHRDLKPGNILVDPEGHALLADFGIAKSLDDPALTRTGHMVGTPAYMAPEQAMAEPVDGQADQYALALTAYRLLAGHLPFGSTASLQTLLQRLQEEPPTLLQTRPDLPALATVLARALHRAPTARWPGMTAFAEALREAALQDGLDLQAPLPPFPPREGQPLDLPHPTAPFPTEAPPTADLPTEALPTLHRPRRRTWGRPLTAVFLVLLGLGLLWWRWPAPASTPPTTAPTPVSLSPAPQTGPESSPQAPRPRDTATPRPRIEAPPAPLPDAPGRPVTYPRVLETPAPVPIQGPCAGRRTTLAVTVGPDGQVRRFRFLTPLPPDCEALARRLVQAYRFSPAQDAQGRPVEATLALSLEFPESP